MQDCGKVEITITAGEGSPAHALPRVDPPRRVPYGVTQTGRLFDEGTIARVGLAMQRELKVAQKRPPGFEA